MYSAMSRVTNKTAEHQKAFETAAAQYGPIGADIKKVAETIVESYKTGNLNTDQEYFRSYKKMSGGGGEPGGARGRADLRRSDARSHALDGAGDGAGWPVELCGAIGQEGEDSGFSSL